MRFKGFFSQNYLVCRKGELHTLGGIIKCSKSSNFLHIVCIELVSLLFCLFILSIISFTIPFFNIPFFFFFINYVQFFLHYFNMAIVFLFRESCFKSRLPRQLKKTLWVLQRMFNLLLLLLQGYWAQESIICLDFEPGA